MFNEIWKKIDEAPDYEISSYGRVSSIKYKEKRILKPTKNKTGYLQIGLCYQTNKRKWFLVHRLVLSAFSPIKNMDIMEVNHKDEDKENNYLDNLEWITSIDNCNYGTRNSKLGVKAIKIICIETGIVYESARAASKLTGVLCSSISNYLHGKQYTAGGYHWEIVNQ
jgi:hypothetical protein